MPNVLHMTPHFPEPPSRIRTAFRPLAALVCVLLLGIPGTLLGADPVGEDSVHAFHLTSDLSGLVDADGGLVFLAAGSRTAALRGELVSLTDSRRRRDAESFAAVVTEGVTGGRRGFSSMADDDQDGRVDEDPLDGIDNDGDGSIDEDFAAVSDAMVAIHLGQPGQSGRGVGLEFYHWNNPTLSSAVFLNAGGGLPAGRATYRIHSVGSGWLETGISSLRHTLGGQARQENLSAFVCQVDRSGESVDDPCDPGSAMWLGVMILAEDSSARFLLKEGRLDLPLGEEAVALVVCAADSWLQLNRILGEATAVHRGLTDPVDSRRAPWIIPPACSGCRSADAPDFELRTGPDGDLVLTANFNQGQCGLLDPDLFRVGSHPLGAPREIRWRSAQGSQSVVPWVCQTSQHLKERGSTGETYLRLLGDLPGHRVAGQLTFAFEAPSFVSEEAPTHIAGQFLDGRNFQSPLKGSDGEIPSLLDSPRTPGVNENHRVSHEPEPAVVEEKARGYAEDRARLLKSGRHPPSLSPDLLIGWPNPFNDIISIRFTVPQTMREAFVWKSIEDQPAEIELEGDVPWSGGQPGVSVKIYSMSGQELVTLHSANEGPGEYTAQWNGTDAFGRKVASGTYFCKLQLDDWSVTRRLVFLR